MRFSVYVMVAMAVPFVQVGWADTCSAPAPAMAVGYRTQTYGLGMHLGENWFIARNQGGISQQGNTILITGKGNDNSFNEQITNIAPDGSGTSFGGGGYFEATMSFTGKPSTEGGWPSFWGGTSPWTGDRIETDIVEWWGVGDAAPNLIFWPSNGGGGQRSDTHKTPLESNFDPSQPNRYAMLWTNDAVTFFINETRGDTIPLIGPYAILNQQKILLTLGTGPNNPITVHGVNVWQATAENNITQGGKAVFNGLGSCQSAIATMDKATAKTTTTSSQTNAKVRKTAVATQRETSSATPAMPTYDGAIPAFTAPTITDPLTITAPDTQPAQIATNKEVFELVSGETLVLQAIAAVQTQQPVATSNALIEQAIAALQSSLAAAQ